MVFRNGLYQELLGLGVLYLALIANVAVRREETARQFVQSYTRLAVVDIHFILLLFFFLVISFQCGITLHSCLTGRLSPFFLPSFVLTSLHSLPLGVTNRGANEVLVFDLADKCFSCSISLLSLRLSLLFQITRHFIFYSNVACFSVIPRTRSLSTFLFFF